VGSVYPIVHEPAGARAGFTHMAKRDVATWLRFLTAHATEFFAFSYDVAVGGVRVGLPDASAEAITGFQYSTALKIDAIGWKAEVAWVIEVRPEATVSALGAALAYTFVAQREQITDKRLIPAIVCEVIQTDVRWVCEQLGVQVIEVGPA
jgi:hypothetical protein